MKLPLYQIDTFTSRLFGGNPAAVVLLDDKWLPDADLAAIAAENNLAETAFVLKHPGLVPLRWFTPKVEVDLCGHATLAAAHALFHHVFPDKDSIVFATNSGTLTVRRSGDLLTMDFPSRPGRQIPVTDELAAALGRLPRSAWLARDLMAVFDTAAEVQALQPDMEKIAAVDAFAVIVTARGEDVDFVSRFFAPRAGIPEDPVTGSAHCTLIPYWAEQLGRMELTARQLSQRGGELYCRLMGDRVEIAGRAVEYLRGEISV